MQAQHRQRRAQLVGGVGDEAALALQQLLDLQQQPIERGLHGFQFARQGIELQGLQGFRIAVADQPGHPPQRFQAPADGQPGQQRQQHQADQMGCEGMAQDAADQIGAHLFALADPEHQVVLGVGQQEAIPGLALQGLLGEARGRRHAEDGRAGRAHQGDAAGVPGLEGHLGLVSVAIGAVVGLGQGLGDTGVQRQATFAAGGGAQHALEDTRALRQLRIVDLADLALAVVDIGQGDQQGADQQQREHQADGAAADGGHGHSRR